MLDDNGYIERFDSDDMLDVLRNQHTQLSYKFDTTLEYSAEDIDSVVVAGMGGSALAADMVLTWLIDRMGVPFVIVRDYELPAFVSDKTLVVCSSYSGNTEETLSTYKQASEKGAKRVVIAQGGQLLELAKEDSVAAYELPTGYQPRLTAWYGVRAFAQILEQIDMLDGVVDELESSADLLEESAKAWGADVATGQNQAKQLAEECMGKSVWVYSGPKLAAAAYKWKININENAKHVSAWNVLPEFNHNEFLGWTEQPRQKPFTVIELQSDLDHDRTQKRFEVTNKLLSGRMPHPIEIDARGESHIEQLLWSCLLGDYVSAYLGILNGVNPTKVEAIEKFKNELS